MVTAKEVKALENSQASLTLTVDAASIEKAYSARIAKYSKEIEMPGFRKGHVPASVIERKYGQAIREESTFDCMEENLKETIETLEDSQRPLPYSTPVLQDEEKLLPFKKDTDITFTVVYDVMPVVQLGQYEGLEVECDDAEVSDEDVEKEIKSLQDQNAMIVTKNGAAAEGDIVKVDYVELDAEGKAVESTERKDFTFTIGSGYNFYKIDSDIIGMAKGDEKKIEKSYTAEDGVPGYEGKTVTLSVKMNEVKYRDLPEVDDDFAQDVKEEYKTVADLKAGIRANLQKDLDQAKENVKSNKILSKIAEGCTVPVPESMVEMELDNRWNSFVKQFGNMPEEQIVSFLGMQGTTKEALLDGWKEDVKDYLKKQFILEEVKKQKDFAIDEEEYNKAVEEQCKTVEDEGVKEYYKASIKDEMQFRQVLPYLLSNNTFKVEKTVSYSEFMNGSRE